MGVSTKETAHGAFDTVGVAPLIDGLASDGFIADKAFDSNELVPVV